MFYIIYKILVHLCIHRVDSDVIIAAHGNFKLQRFEPCLVGPEAVFHHKSNNGEFDVTLIY